MEAKIEALEPRTSGALFFLLGNRLGNQHIASQRADVTGSESVVHLQGGSSSERTCSKVVILAPIPFSSWHWFPEQYHAI
jgi:hypothetical protein